MSQGWNYSLKFNRTAFSLPIIFGYIILIGVAIFGVFISPERSLQLYLGMGGLTILVLLFGSITVKIFDDVILISYGIGIFRRIISVHTLVNLRVVPNKFLSALYNLRAESVLEISDRRGSRAIIPLGDPREMLNFLRMRVRDQ